MTNAQLDQLKNAPESDPEDEKWRKTWRILFGDDKEALENIPSPCKYNLGHVSHHEMLIIPIDCSTPLDRSPLFDKRHEQLYQERIFEEGIDWIASQIRSDHPDLNERWTGLSPDIIRSVQHNQCYPGPRDSVRSSFYPDSIDDCGYIDPEWGLPYSAQKATNLSSETTPSEVDQEDLHSDETFGEPSDFHNLTDSEKSSALHLLASLESIIQQHSSGSGKERVFYFSGHLKDFLENRGVGLGLSNCNETPTSRFLIASESGQVPSSNSIAEGIRTLAGNPESSSSSPPNLSRKELDSPETTSAGFSASNKKRPVDDGKGPGGGSGPGQRKRAKKLVDDNDKRLACPYFKRYPQSSAIVRACVLPGFSDPNRLTYAPHPCLFYLYTTLISQVNISDGAMSFQAILVTRVSIASRLLVRFKTTFALSHASEMGNGGSDILQISA